MTQPTNVADEIAKLGELYQSGAIAEDEFRNYKARLLAAGQTTATVPGNLYATTKRAAILTLSGIVIGTLAGFLPPMIMVPRNGFGGMIFQNLYIPNDYVAEYTAKVFWSTSTETAASYFLFFLLIWLVVRSVKSPIVIGAAAGLLYGVTRFMMAMPSVVYLMSLPDSNLSDGILERQLSLLGQNSVAWAIIFTIISFVAMRPKKTATQMAGAVA